MINLIPPLVGIFLATLTYAAARSILSRFGAAGVKSRSHLVGSLIAGVAAAIAYMITMQSISEGVTK